MVLYSDGRWRTRRRRIQDFGRRGGSSESLERKSAIRVGNLWDKYPQKLVIFCKSYYDDAIWKKEKQHLST